MKMLKYATKRITMRREDGYGIRESVMGYIGKCVHVYT